MNPVMLIRAATGWSQRALADRAGTSQPTIAAYESGGKSPTWRTIERIAGAANLAVYPCVGRPMTRDQFRSIALHQAIARQLVDQPEAVVAKARQNLKVMGRSNPNARPLLEEWNAILGSSTTEIVSQMLDPSEHGRDLRQVTPFAGVLTARQRAVVYRAFRQAA